MKALRLVAVALALLVPLQAAAYVRTVIQFTDTCLFWKERTLAWSASAPLGAPDEEAALQTVRASFAVWAAESCTDLAFDEGARVARATGFSPEGPNVNTIVFRERDCSDVVPADDPCRAEDSCAAAYDCWGEDDRLIAVTTSTFSQCSGRMVDSDIEFNGATFRFTTGDGPTCASATETGCIDTDIQNTLVHEIGHLIGLDHTPVQEATMFASAGTGEVKKRDLAEDDRAAICAVYPAGGPTSICEPARPLEECGEGEITQAEQAGGCGCAAGTGGGGGALGLALGLLLLRRGARRRT